MGTDFPTYETALDWLRSATDYERMQRVRYNANTFDLSRMEALLEALGGPHRTGRYLHIAGTKGKGSTATMVSEVLRAAGHRVGLYTSPHVRHLRERIMVNGTPIDRETFRKVLSRIRPVAEALTGEGSPTFFEIMTAAALIHFQEAQVEVAVLEVGLGGRLDATNLVHPLACAITSISLDHTEQLGGTIETIAREKAGIIKQGVPVVCAPQQPEALKIIRDTAASKNAPLWLVGRDLLLTRWKLEVRNGRVGTSLSLHSRRGKYEDLWLALVGKHQAENAAVALGLLERAAEEGLVWGESDLRRGLATAHPSARVQVLARNPWVVNDGAHNPASVRALVEVIKEALPHRRMILVFASARDKDYIGSLKELLPLAHQVITTSTASPRSAPPEELARAARRLRPVPVEAIPGARGAARRALQTAGPEDLVCFTGSFYLAGLVDQWWEEEGGEKHRNPGEESE